MSDLPMREILVAYWPAWPRLPPAGCRVMHASDGRGWCVSCAWRYASVAAASASTWRIAPLWKIDPHARGSGHHEAVIRHVVRREPPPSEGWPRRDPGISHQDRVRAPATGPPPSL